jgi:metal-responsive CopG/Arc/MetJ family transcriptional regulator
MSPLRRLAVKCYGDVIKRIRLNIMGNATVRTTLAIPAELLAETDRIVSEGKVRSRNQFIAQALEHEIAALKRAEIDAALAEMAQDVDYQAEVLQIEREFANASWEALLLEENP